MGTMMASPSWLFLVISVLAYTTVATVVPSFDIDYKADTFRMDGKPFRYVSGSLHYFRVPRELWQDRMRKVRAAGFNAIQFVIPWHLHEPLPGKYNFEGMYDLKAFIQMAQDEDLYVLLRPGPYICAEHNGGGLPFWLYGKHPNITLRSSDPDFLQEVDKWWAVLLPLIRDQLYINGGNILMVQLENEYGSYGLQTGKCDTEYMRHLLDLVRQYLGPKVLMYTTDGAGDAYVRCGSIAGAYATIDFGPGVNVSNAFAIQRKYTPHGPLVNSEFYPGWLDYWGLKHNVVDGNWSAEYLDTILATGANVNIYMAHGGTSFGFDNGANYNSRYRAINPPFQVEPTSYDYDAPISEAGDLTAKFYDFQKVIKKYFAVPAINISQPQSPKGNYGKVQLKYVSSFFVANGTLLKKVGQTSKLPMTFEEVGQENGFLLYETELDRLFSDPAKLEILGVHDRAYIFLNHQPKGILSRAEEVLSMPLTVNVGDTLHILVENQGRIGYGAYARDFKGIVSNVTLGKTNLYNWTTYSMPFNDTAALLKYVDTMIDLKSSNTDVQQIIRQDLKDTKGQGSLWYGEFNVPCNQSSNGPLDTFLSFTNAGWYKGLAFVNDKHIGKYWPKVGPQMTLYIPGVWLKCNQKNTIVLFEQDHIGCDHNNSCYVELVSTHIIDGPVPPTVQNPSLLPSFSREHF